MTWREIENMHVMDFFHFAFYNRFGRLIEKYKKQNELDKNMIAAAYSHKPIAEPEDGGMIKRQITVMDHGTEYVLDDGKRKKRDYSYTSIKTMREKTKNDGE